MALMTVYQASDPVLHKKAKPLQRIDGTLRKTIEDMFETMHHNRGMGLAATQVGILSRFFVGEYDDQRYVLINPEILSRSKETDIAEEGCLSLPGYVGKVERAVRVTVRARTLKGKEVTYNAEGTLARMFQHEIDHLDGIMFTDRMAPGERLRPVRDDEYDEDEAEAIEARV